MKFAARSKIEFLLFLCILMLSFAVLRPLIHTLEHRLSAIRDNILTELEKTYNIRIYYESLSPSLLRTVSLRNIKIYDAEHNIEIASFEDFSIQYRFTAILTGNIAEILDSVNIANGFVDIDLIENEALAGKINTLLQSQGEQPSPGKQSTSADTERILSFFSSQLLTVHIKNVRLRFRNAVHTVDTRITDGYFNIDSDALTASINSTASYRNSAYMDMGTAETAFTLEGKFNKDLTAGSAVANFSQITTDQFSISRLKLFTDYRDNVVTFNTMQDFQPIDFTAAWNTETNDITGRFSCKDFIPLQSIALYNMPKALVQFSPSAVSGALQFAISKQLIHWDMDLHILLPKLSFSSYKLAASKMHIKAEGNNKDIEVSHLSLAGPDIDVSSKLAFNLDTKLPSGQLAVKRFQLPSGTPVTADLKFSTRKNTFFLTIPLITVGEGMLKNINVTVNPSGQRADYTLSAEDGYGKYSFDGSYIYDNNRAGNTADSPHFLELHGAFDAVSIGNINRFIHAALPSADIPLAATESLECTTEFYISSDLHSFSYNCIRFVLVSNKVSDFYALISLKGNQSSFALTDIDIVYKNMSVRGDINADFERLNDIIFTSSLIINSIGYQIQGFFSQNILNIYGDYGLAISALYEKGTGLRGTVKTDEMPMPFLPLFLTLDSNFRYTHRKDWNYHIDSGYLSYGTPASLAQALLGISFTGTADPSGLFLSEIQFGSEDPLSGTLAVKAPAHDAGDSDEASDAYTAAIRLASSDAAETLELDTQFTLTGAFGIGGSLKIDNVSLGRFLYTQSKEHSISAEASFSGTPEALSLRFDLSQLSLFVQGHDLSTAGSLVIENETADISITKLEWGAHQAAGIAAHFSASDLSGMLDADYAGEAVKKRIKTHIHAVFNSVQPENNGGLFSRLKGMREQFTFTTYLSDWQFGDSAGKEVVPVSIIHEKEVTALYAGKNDEITGFILNDGVVSLQFADTLPLCFNLDGTIKKEVLDLKVADIRADIKRIWDITGLDYVSFYGGALTGSLAIGGKPLEPEFSGKLEGRNITVNSPHYAPEIFGPVSLDVIADGTVLEIPYTVLKGPSANLWARCTAEFSGWIPADVAIQCGTLDSKLGVMKTDNILFKADGFAGCTLDINITPSLIGLYGSATFDSGYFVFKFNDLDKFTAKYANAGKHAFIFDMKLDLQLGHKTEFRWPTSDFPILRTLVPTETPLTLTVDGNRGAFSMKGDVKMRGGEVFYIKRNFYIREGNITFADMGKDVEPMITLRAEIRDRDETGEPIRLILTAKDQPLFSFNPTLNSDPPRSSSEIMQFLGQVITGDTRRENVLQNLLVTSSDIIAQAGLFKKAETKMRDFLKLDAFSFRTLLLQNAIFGNLFNSNKNTTLTMSNYLDNTSVYIGKYFGSAIYADALLHLSHYDEKSLKNSGSGRPVYNNLLFQPEIGLEMATPFFLLRWSVAPTKPDTLFVGDAALTFSWKYSY